MARTPGKTSQASRKKAASASQTKSAAAAQTPASTSSSTSSPASIAKATHEVDVFLDALEHPYKADIVLVRRIILAIDSQIKDAIKWNAPSFRTTEFFATFHLRAKDGVQLIFHTGAKVKATAQTGLEIDDPAHLLTWLAKDRALVNLGHGTKLRGHQSALEDLVRQWIGWL